MDGAALIAFLGLAVTMGVVPGPDWMFMLTSTARRTEVLTAASGLGAGHVAIALAVTAGLGPLGTAQPIILDVLSVVGGAYLIYLGVGVLRSMTTTPTTTAATEAPLAVATFATVFRQGMAVTGLNPKAWLFYLVLLPQFARPSGSWPIPAQMAVLGLVFAALCMAATIAVGYLAGVLIHSRPRVSTGISCAAGIIMMILGVVLLIEQTIAFGNH